MSETGGRVGLGQQSTARRATQHAETERRRAIRDVPLLPQFTQLLLAPSLFRTADTERLSLFPPPEITLSRDPVGLFGLSPNRRTPCGRCRVPRQRSYVSAPLLRSPSRREEHLLIE